MKLTICGSLDFTHEIKCLATVLNRLGFEVDIPPTAQLVLNGETSVEELKIEKENGSFAERNIRYDVIREYWKIIKRADAILVANYTIRETGGYIGGNTFLEMGFSHILNKPMYLLNDTPEMMYSDEIKTMQPIVLNGDLNKIKAL